MSATRPDIVCRLLPALCASLLVACAGIQPTPGATRAFAAYVLLAEAPDGRPVPFGRVIVAAGEGCPVLLGATSPIATSRRDNPHGFEVDVCEAELPFGQALKVAGTDFVLPAARRGVARVAVLGDTGCKPKDQSGCGADDPAWPFPRLALAAVAGSPDLVLHVGDYNYRGTPSGFDTIVNGKTTRGWYYDAGDGAPVAEQCGALGVYLSQNSSGNPAADSWQPWWLDFFQPAAPLLAAAPWVFARGNHELCSHGGPGWLYFLGPSSKLPAGGGAQLGCPSQDPGGALEAHLVFQPPQVIALDDLSVAVLDSANACDLLNNQSARYARQFSAIAARLPEGSAWLMGHRPLWGVEGNASEPPYRCDNQPGSGAAEPYTVLNRTLQCALAAANGPALLPRLDLSLAGHMHRFQWLRFEDGSARPPQVILGNGGVLEDSAPPTAGFIQQVDGETATGYSVESFGFVRLARDAGGAWRGAVVTPDPAAWGAHLPACGSTPDADYLCVEGLP